MAHRGRQEQRPPDQQQRPHAVQGAKIGNQFQRQNINHPVEEVKASS